MASLLDPRTGAIRKEAEPTPYSPGERLDIPEELFGLPNVRKFPLQDEEQVNIAIENFDTVYSPHRKELAGRINTRAKALGITLVVSKDSKFYRFADKNLLESK